MRSIALRGLMNNDRDCQRKVDMFTSRFHRLRPRYHLLLLRRAVENNPSLWKGEGCIDDQGLTTDPNAMFQQ